VGEGLDPAVVLVTAPVEHDGVDACLLGPGAEQGAHLGGGVHGQPLRAELGLPGGRGHVRGALEVVDDLRVEVAVAAVYRGTGTIRRGTHARAGATVPSIAGYLMGGAHHLPAFPALRRTYSPA